MTGSNNNRNMNSFTSFHNELNNNSFHFQSLELLKATTELLSKEYGYHVEALKYLAPLNCMVKKCTKRMLET